jgi:CDP-diacylglycerol--serine O-phosphatidyltransferase
MRAPLHDVHVSNLLTYGSLAAAVTAVAASVGAHNTPAAGCALALAAIMDTFDGRFARRFHRSPRQARLGHELDSLVDAVTFGLAPVVVVSAQFPSHSPAAVVSWSVALFYVLAVVTRLAFYNVQEDQESFVGIPTPAAALICCTSLLLPLPGAAACWPLALGGVLMIAPLPIARPRARELSFFAAWAASLVIALTALAIRSSAAAR